MEPMDTMFEEFSTNRWACVLVLHVADSLNYSKGKHNVTIVCSDCLVTSYKGLNNCITAVLLFLQEQDISCFNIRQNHNKTKVNTGEHLPQNNFLLAWLLILKLSCAIISSLTVLLWVEVFWNISLKLLYLPISQVKKTRIHYPYYKAH